MAKAISGALLEQHRYINVIDDDWWDYVWEEFAADLHIRGIDPDMESLRFSCGYCQGDDCNFEATLDLAKLLSAHQNLAREYPEAGTFAQWGLLDGKVTLRRHGGNSYSMHAELYVECDWHTDSEDLRDIAKQQLYKAFDLGGFEKEVTGLCRGYAKDLHRQLYEEMEYLTSDEAVRATLEASPAFDEDEDDTGEADGAPEVPQQSDADLVDAVPA